MKVLRPLTLIALCFVLLQGYSYAVFQPYFQLPSQTGNSGKVLGTNGTTSSWVTNGSGGVTGITAGSNVVVTGPTTSPIVAVTNAPTFTGLTVSSASNTVLNFAASSGTVTETITATTPVLPSPGPNTYGLIKFANTTYPGQIPKLGAGVADSGDGSTHGGYFIISSTSYAASPISIEGIIVSPGGHVGLPQNVLPFNVSSPATCAGLTVCGTYTATFNYPYVTNAGAPQNPNCVAPGIEDSTAPSTIWVGNVVAGSESSTSVQYNYTPLIATTGVHSLVLISNCYQGAF